MAIQAAILQKGWGWRFADLFDGYAAMERLHIPQFPHEWRFLLQVIVVVVVTATNAIGGHVTTIEFSRFDQVIGATMTLAVCRTTSQSIHD